MRKFLTMGLVMALILITSPAFAQSDDSVAPVTSNTTIGRVDIGLGAGDISHGDKFGRRAVKNDALTYNAAMSFLLRISSFSSDKPREVQSYFGLHGFYSEASERDGVVPSDTISPSTLNRTRYGAQLRVLVEDNVGEFQYRLDLRSGIVGAEFYSTYARFWGSDIDVDLAYLPWMVNKYRLGPLVGFDGVYDVAESVRGFDLSSVSVGFRFRTDDPSADFWGIDFSFVVSLGGITEEEEDFDVSGGLMQPRIEQYQFGIGGRVDVWFKRSRVFILVQTGRYLSRERTTAGRFRADSENNRGITAVAGVDIIALILQRETSSEISP